jgi:hypothetical protein
VQLRGLAHGVVNGGRAAVVETELENVESKAFDVKPVGVG